MSLIQWKVPSVLCSKIFSFNTDLVWCEWFTELGGFVSHAKGKILPSYVGKIRAIDAWRGECFFWIILIQIIGQSSQYHVAINFNQGIQRWVFRIQILFIPSNMEVCSPLNMIIAYFYLPYESWSLFLCHKATLQNL